MTPTNNEIYTALITILNGAALGYPVAYPGFNFTPPSTGVWLEVSFFPNQGISNGIANSDSVVPQGIFQVACVARPGAGISDIHAAAESVGALYGKGIALASKVRVSRNPYSMEITSESDRLMTVVSVEYSA